MARLPITKRMAENTLAASLEAMKKTKELPAEFLPTKDQTNVLLSLLMDRDNFNFLQKLKTFALK